MIRNFIYFSLLFVFTLACSRETSEKLHLAHFLVGDDQKALESLSQNFKLKNSRYKIQLQYVPMEEFDAWLMNQFALNSPPDIFLTSSPGLIRRLASAGKIRDLTNLWQSWKDQNYYSSRWEEVVAFESRVWALPFSVRAEDLAWVGPNFDTKKFPDSFESFISGLSLKSEKHQDVEALTRYFEAVFIRRAGTDGFRALIKNQYDWKSKEALQIIADFERFLKSSSANQQARFFLKRSEVERASDFFTWPGHKGMEPPGLLVSSYYLAARKNEEQTQDNISVFFNFVSSPEAQEQMVSKSSLISAHKLISAESYEDRMRKKEVELLQFSPVILHKLSSRLDFERNKKFQNELKQFAESFQRDQFIKAMEEIFRSEE